VASPGTSSSTRFKVKPIPRPPIRIRGFGRSEEQEISAIICLDEEALALIK